MVNAMFPHYIGENIDIFAIMSVREKKFWFPWQPQNSGTQASIEQLIFQISNVSNEIKTSKYLPPVYAVIPRTPLCQVNVFFCFTPK